MSALQKGFASAQRTIALDRLEASLAASGAVKAAVACRSTTIRRGSSSARRPPSSCRSTGLPSCAAIPGTNFERVINTRALIVREQGDPDVLPARLRRLALVGRGRRSLGSGHGVATGHWPDRPGPRRDRAGRPARRRQRKAEAVPRGRRADDLRERDAGRAARVQGTAELRAPSRGPSLDRASNTNADVFFDTAGRNYYVLLAGRWYRAALLTGPWSFVASTDLPSDFRRIPGDSPAGVVLAAVAGTPQAQEAVIANSIPQTATIPRVNGPTVRAGVRRSPGVSARSRARRSSTSSTRRRRSSR